MSEKSNVVASGVFQATARVLNDMMIMKYNMGLNHEHTVALLEMATYNPSSPVFETQIKGCSIMSAIDELNMGVKDKICKFKSSETGDRYCINFTATRIPFAKYCDLLEDFSGFANGIAITSYKNKRGDTCYHSVACFSKIGPEVKAKNSWAKLAPVLTLSANNAVEVVMIEPKLLFIEPARRKKNQTEPPQPPPANKTFDKMFGTAGKLGAVACNS